MSSLTMDNRILDEATEWLVRLQSEDMPQQEELFAEWLAADEQHAAAYIEVERQWQSLGAVEQIYRDSVQTDKPQPTADNVVAFPSWASLPRALAASVAMFLVSALAYVYVDYRDNRYLTAVGEQAEYVLSDGTRISLNTNTLLHTDLDDDIRYIDLQRGEAFFSVAKDTSRPFIVNMGDGQVRVLGTQFNVLRGEFGSQVTVTEGVVGVTTDAEQAIDLEEEYQAEVTLVQNQQLTVEKGGVAKPTLAVDASIAAAWRKGKLVYNGETLASVLSDMSRYFEGEIRVGEAELEGLEVIAVLQLQDKKTTIKALEANLELVAVDVSSSLTLLYPVK